MAHFAELDNNNKVIRVIVVHNNELLDENGVESESNGIAFCKSLYGQNTNWVQTSYNGSFRKKFASIEDFYDVEKNVFMPIKPYDSWIFNEENWYWKAPTPYPTNGGTYKWVEDDLNWQPIESEV